jgi:hypothetical protein
MNFARIAPRRVSPPAAALALWLAGCAVPVVAPPTVPPPVPPAQMPQTPPTPPGATTPPVLPVMPASPGGWTWSTQMDNAASKLRSALRGSAVDVAQTTDQRLWLSVPVDDAFPAGRSALKPPAAAWLDHVALALRDLPRAEVQIVGQPDAKGGGGAALALDRAASARDWMVARGVAARRVAVSSKITRNTSAGANRLDILIGEKAPGR